MHAYNLIADILLRSNSDNLIQFPLVMQGADLQTWEDTDNGWEDSNTDLTWQAEAEMKENRRKEREIRSQEQHRKIQERAAKKGLKNDVYFSAVRLSQPRGAYDDVIVKYLYHHIKLYILYIVVGICIYIYMQLSWDTGYFYERNHEDLKIPYQSSLAFPETAFQMIMPVRTLHQEQKCYRSIGNVVIP